MPLSRAIRLVVLESLVLILGTIVYVRGFGWRLGAAPASLEGLYATEEAWIVGEIVRDVTEMSAYPAKLRTEPVVSSVADVHGRYLITLTPVTAPIELDLRDDLWNPAAFAGIARSMLAAQSGAATSDASALPAVHPALMDLTPASLIDANRSVSRALAGNMRSVRAHEAAALVLGAFALRDSAARSSDTRWAMNRITAHLALAQALGNTSGRGIDGELADATLMTLAMHQTRAAAALDRLNARDRSDAVQAWSRALRMRIAEDWRVLATPERASRLEKREYFRARRATVPSIKPTIELSSIGEEADVDWMRIMEGSSLGVGDGRLLDRMLELERDEYQDVYRRMHGREMAWLSHALNAHAVRLIGDDGPDVLPWGAWAEFAQRHLAMLVGRADSYYRRMLGSDSAADREKRRLKVGLGTLWMFPAATAWWTKGPRGGDADFTFINQAVDRTVEAPHLLPAMAWSFIERGTKLEPVRRGLPPPGDWFVRPEPRAMYDAGARVKYSGHARSLEIIEAMRKEAPYDYALASEYLTTRFGEHATAEEMIAAHGARRNYDLRVIRPVEKLANDLGVRLRLLRRGCELSGFECVALGNELADERRDAEAAVSYERAFGDRSVDEVAVANSSGWLVNYYFRTQQFEKAVALAERIAGTGAANGLATAAYLYERLDRSGAAEDTYARIASRYDDPSQLLGFYYRSAVVRRRSEYEKKWRNASAEMFPDGLVPVPASDAKPARGVIVVKDSELSKEAGLQAGDIIVGIEGFRVENLRQYLAINAFFEREDMKITAWRGQAKQIAVKAPRRLMGAQFRTHPIEGWSE